MLSIQTIFEKKHIWLFSCQIFLYVIYVSSVFYVSSHLVLDTCSTVGESFAITAAGKGFTQACSLERGSAESGDNPPWVRHYGRRLSHCLSNLIHSCYEILICAALSEAYIT